MAKKLVRYTEFFLKCCFVITLAVYPGGIFWINCLKEACSSVFLIALAPSAIILVILFIMRKLHAPKAKI